MRGDMDEPEEEPKHYVLEVQSATISTVEAPKEAEEKDDGQSSS